MSEKTLKRYDGITCIDRETIERLHDLFDDEESRAEFLNELVDTYESSGKAVVERMMQALDSEDMETLCSLAHRLKGQSRNIGALRLGFLTEDLEAWTNDPGKRVDSELRAYCRLLRDEFFASCSELRGRYLPAAS